MIKNIRLEKIMEQIPFCDCTADIGTDHGKLACELALKGRCRRVIASDISPGSLEKAKMLASDMGVSDIVSCVLADGLDGTDGADCIVIAGMGGLTISDILERGIEKAKRAKLVLCPHTEADALRTFLAVSGFAITKEECVYDSGKFYMIICASEGCMKLNESDILLGKHDAVVCSREYAGYLNYLSEKYLSEIRRMQEGGADILQIKEKVSILGQVKGRLEWLNQ